MENDNATATIDISTLSDTVKSGVEEVPFLGEIGCDQFEPGERGPRYHYGVKPLSFTLRSRTGMLHTWARVPFVKDDAGQVVFDANGRPEISGGRGEYGKIKKALFENGISGNLGSGELLGKVAWFVQRVLTYGKDKDGKLIQGGQPTLIAVRRATAKDVLENATAHDLTADERNSVGAIGLTEAQYAAALELVDGKKPTEYFKRAGALEDLDLKRALLNGAAQEHLVASGMAVEKAGVLVRA